MKSGNKANQKSFYDIRPTSNVSKFSFSFLNELHFKFISVRSHEGLIFNDIYNLAGSVAQIYLWGQEHWPILN